MEIPILAIPKFTSIFAWTLLSAFQYDVAQTGWTSSVAWTLLFSREVQRPNKNTSLSWWLQSTSCRIMTIQNSAFEFKSFSGSHGYYRRIFARQPDVSDSQLSTHQRASCVFFWLFLTPTHRPPIAHRRNGFDAPHVVFYQPTASLRSI